MNFKKILAIIGLVTLINVIARVMGFFREVVIGIHFGTSSMADSVVLAYTLPNFIYLVLGGAITTSFISIYNKIENDVDKLQFKKVIHTYTSILLLIIVIVLMFYNNKVTYYMFPGVEERELTEKLFLITVPSTYFLVLSTWFSGILNVNGKYLGASMAVLANNACFLILIFVLYPFMNVYAYGWGAVISSIIMFVILAIELSNNKYLPFSFSLRYKNQGELIRMLKICVPILLGGATLQFYFLIQRVFASYLSEGYVAAINYAAKLVQLPQVIVMTSVTTVIYPLLAKKVANKQYDDINQIFNKGTYILFISIIPLSIYIYFFAEDIVKIIFQYGSFDMKSSQMTAQMLKIFVVGMYAHAANMYITRFYYALEKPGYSVLVSIFSVFILNIAIFWILFPILGPGAVAWGTTISAYFQYFALLIMRKHILNLKVRDRANFIHYIFIIIVMVIVLGVVSKLVDFKYEILNLIVTFGIFLITFVVSLFTLGIRPSNLKNIKKGI